MLIPSCFSDHFAAGFRDLSVSRDRGLTLVRGIAIDTVASTVANQDTSCLLKLSDEGLTLHTSSSTGCR